ncbi:hypothetical protein [Anaeromyxobacter sp. PSR-1]|uniref:hypothetical protein n=1 Tax=Anaeromyxobacter sp. PSR-1 TaxID=1300915 RepID=UPI0005E823E4|nr:hypothetical protein [Anaeromyxobacter sp. PSR-1]GAO01915.1 hypothetical protein PSR1_00778 [Anaeromyxobacter sp. PSR-1]
MPLTLRTLIDQLMAIAQANPRLLDRTVYVVKDGEDSFIYPADIIVWVDEGGRKQKVILDT